MSTRSTTLDQLTASVDAAVDLAEALDTLARGTVNTPALRVLEDHGIEVDDTDGVLDLLDELIDSAALEVYGNARIDHHGVTLTGVVVVTGVGGPHIEFEVSDTGRLEARGYWSSDKARRTSRDALPTLGDYLAGMFGGWEQDR